MELTASCCCGKGRAGCRLPQPWGCLAVLWRWAELRAGQETQAGEVLGVCWGLGAECRCWAVPLGPDSQCFTSDVQNISVSLIPSADAFLGTIRLAAPSDPRCRFSCSGSMLGSLPFARVGQCPMEGPGLPSLSQRLQEPHI